MSKALIIAEKPSVASDNARAGSSKQISGEGSKMACLHLPTLQTGKCCLFLRRSEGVRVRATLANIGDCGVFTDQRESCRLSVQHNQPRGQIDNVLMASDDDTVRLVTVSEPATSSQTASPTAAARSGFLHGVHFSLRYLLDGAGFRRTLEDFPRRGQGSRRTVAGHRSRG